MTGDPISVLLVDDQELVRYGFRVILGLADGIEVVGEAADGRQAIDQARQLHPDVILMDVQMPTLDGLAATRELVADPQLGSAVLILTTFDRDDYLYQALQAGASGFLLKNSSPEGLVEAVRVVAAGDALLSPAVTKRVIARFANSTGPDGADGAADGGAGGGVGGGVGSDRRDDGGRQRADDHGTAGASATRPTGDDLGRDRRHSGGAGAPAHVPELTERESEVLALIAQGKSNAEIAAALVVGEATVKTHVSNLLAKLQLRDRIQAVIYAYEHRIVTPAG